MEITETIEEDEGSDSDVIVVSSTIVAPDAATIQKKAARKLKRKLKQKKKEKKNKRLRAQGLVAAPRPYNPGPNMSELGAGESSLSDPSLSEAPLVHMRGLLAKPLSLNALLGVAEPVPNPENQQEEEDPGFRSFHRTREESREIRQRISPYVGHIRPMGIGADSLITNSALNASSQGSGGRTEPETTETTEVLTACSRNQGTSAEDAIVLD